MNSAGHLARLLATNLETLMQVRAGLHTQAAVAKAASVDQRTVGRILKCEHAPTLAQVEKLAKAFSLQPWQLLAPDLDADDLPVLVLNRSQSEAWRSIRLAAETIGRYKPLS
jgi:transcriptional regulator with XRE-family HTH domain